jgi:hypothetical protein
MSQYEDLSDLSEDLAYVRTVFDGLTEALVRFVPTMPRTVPRAREILDSALNWAMSLERQEFESDEEESNSGNIGSREVAELLKVTPRTVQRNAEDLGGQRVSGSWVFNKDEVIGATDG